MFGACSAAVECSDSEIFLSGRFFVKSVHAGYAESGGFLIEKFICFFILFKNFGREPDFAYDSEFATAGGATCAD